MKRSLFPILTVGILLAGALIGTAAIRSLIAPPVGEIISAGVQNVPSIPGLTADQLLFHPWDSYALEKCSPMTEAFLADPYSDLNQAMYALIPSAIEQAEDNPEALLEQFLPVVMLPSDWDLQYEQTDLEAHMEWSTDNNGREFHVFLTDLPAKLSRDASNTDITLSCGISCPRTSVNGFSMVAQPAQAVSVSDEARQAALDKVDSDLYDLFQIRQVCESLYYGEADSSNLTLTYASPTDVLFLAPSLVAESWEAYFRHPSGLGPYLLHLQDATSGSLDLISSLMESCLLTLDDVSTDLDLDAMLDRLEELQGWSVQRISTPTQIALLFHNPYIGTIGFYYDITLACYTGMGFSF